MNPITTQSLTSVIIPCWNQLEFTRHCISAVMKSTRQPYELLVINNGSTDGTQDYLAGVQDASSMPVMVITNETNRGFPAAINQGLHLARGEYLVLLNNDVVVTDGWLEQLIGLASASVSDAGIGLVGPMSNYAAPPQLVEDVPYPDLSDLKAFAKQWRTEHRGKWFTVPKLSGFCLLMKRAVYDAVGGLDERFGLGLFDDDDLAERARRAGFELAVAHDLFVHHFGSRTFVGNGIDTERVLDENAAKFAAKWGDSKPRGMRVALKAFPASPGQRRIKSNGSGLSIGSGAWERSSNGLSSSEAGIKLAASDVDDVRVSLTMIVRDEENNLSSCLESVRGLFDEIVVVDTGSKDRTVEIARSFGARVFDFVWVDDFAAARNAALARARGDYAFWLDADDVIEPPERAKLEALLNSLRENRRGEMGAGVDGASGGLHPPTPLNMKT